VLNAIPATAGSVSTSYLVDGSVTQAKLSTNVAGNGPAFSAYRSSAQTVTSATFTKVQFNAENFDTANAYDATTNYRFQPLLAGYYFIQFAISSYSGATTAQLAVLYKNGSATNTQIYNYAFSSNALDDWGVGTSGLVYMNGSTDYLEVYGYVISSTTPTFDSGTSIFSGFLARAA
jgi:hypothetical protein